MGTALIYLGLAIVAVTGLLIIVRKPDALCT